MNEHVLDQIDDFVDGRLAAEQAEQLRLHLAECAECRNAERQLRSMLAAAANLPASIEPPAQVWQAVRLRTVDAGRQRRAALWSIRYQLASAAVLLILVSSGLTALLLQPADGGASDPVAAQADPRAALSSAEQEFVRIATELEATLAGRSEAIDTATARLVRENLDIIDRAIADARSALERDPLNPDLGRLISTNYRRKIQVLESTLRLSARS